MNNTINVIHKDPEMAVFNTSLSDRKSTFQEVLDNKPKKKKKTERRQKICLYEEY